LRGRPLLIYPTYYAVEAVGDPKKIAKMRLALQQKHAAAEGAAAGGAAAAEGAAEGAAEVSAVQAAAVPTSTATPTALDDVTFNLNRYASDWWAVSKVSMQVWIPANFLNFRFMPTNLRTPFMGVMAFGYTTFFAAQQAQLRRKDGDVGALSAAGCDTGVADDAVVTGAVSEGDV
jgi:hypothetical protein